MTDSYAERLQKENKELEEEKDALLKEIQDLEKDRVEFKEEPSLDYNRTVSNEGGVIYDSSVGDIYTSPGLEFKNVEGEMVDLAQTVKQLQDRIEELEKKQKPFWKRWFH